ncbi:MAG: hypothetical protein SCARUB_01499 [Candidatus Scalindua rubra]|uniref:RDD domain-containing protein n=1 Tax=Candidatus Scalindua rubra TaxID=1872076 RepID=A0A1E3XCR1_9BACT|nr:MAG: hypothetical protein SCARUB_01499 [Candidatus Scalindua rubra]
MECTVYIRKDYGGFWRRIFADSIDAIPLGLAWGAVTEIFKRIIEIYKYSAMTDLFIVSIIILILDIVIFLAYMVGFKVFMGETPGYWSLGIKTVAINGAAVTVKQIVIRAISSFFSLLAFGLGFFWITIDKNKQAWQDKIAGTYVVRSRAMPVRTIEIPRRGLIRTGLFALQFSTPFVLIFIVVSIIVIMVMLKIEDSFSKLQMAINEKVHGPDHPDVARSLNRLARLYESRRKYDEAQPLYNRALAIREKALGSDHPDVAEPLENLARLYHFQGKYAEAETLYKRALAVWEKVRPDHPGVATVLENMAKLYKKTGREGEAERLEERAKRIRLKNR